MKKKFRTSVNCNDVEYWLGTSNPLEEAIEIIKELANGSYSPRLLKHDIEHFKRDLPR